VAICASVCNVCTGCCAAHSTQCTQHILPLYSNNFNDVFLLIISTKTVTLARFRHKLPDDGLHGPKNVGSIQRDILSVSFNILCFKHTAKATLLFSHKIIHVHLCKTDPVLWYVFTRCYCSNRSTLQILYTSVPLLFTECGWKNLWTFLSTASLSAVLTGHC
jgi:hypothetical protein